MRALLVGVLAAMWQLSALAAVPPWIELTSTQRVRTEAVTAVTFGPQLVTVLVAEPQLSFASREQAVIDLVKEIVSDANVWTALGQDTYVRIARVGIIQVLCSAPQGTATCDQALVSSTDEALSNVVVSGAAASAMKTLATSFLQIDDNASTVTRIYVRPTAIKTIAFDVNQSTGKDASAEVRISTRGRYVVRDAGALERLRKLQS